MVWTWRYEDAQGGAVEGPTEAFPNQSDAESWVGQTWRELLDSGVATIVLLEDERTDYRMSLLPAAE